MTTLGASVSGPPATRRRNLASWDGGVRALAGASLWASLLLVTYWWEADGGVRDLGGWVTGLTSLGRLTGLVASVLLLAQVLLMARLPVLERAFGQDRLARIHRVVGFTSFDLMLAHVVLITWGYAGGLPATLSMLWSLTVDYPGMLLAAAGTVCLILVVVTSLRAARRRLRYESWHLLHLYAYLGAGLALPHQLWTGQEFLKRPAETFFWWTAWAVAAGAVVVWRLALPLWRSLRAGIVVTAVVPEAHGIVSVYLAGRIDRLRAEPGQFLTWRFLGRQGWTRANPYSLSAAPNGRTARITVQADGDGSASVARIRPGTRVLVEGPFGRLTPRARTRRKVVFIGAGVGMAPIRALAEGMAYAPGEAVLLQRHRDGALFEKELDWLQEARGLRVVRLPGRRRAETSWVGHGFHGYDDLQVLLGWVPDIAERDVYICGPAAWTAAVRRAARAAGVGDEQWHEETFEW